MRRTLLVLLTLAGAACEDVASEASRDAAPDAGASADGAPAGDAGLFADTGPLPDAGAEPDAARVCPVAATALLPLVDAYETGALDGPALLACLRALPAEAPPPLGGTLPHDTLIRGGPWRLEGDLTVPPGTVLAVEAGATVVLPEGAALRVDGRLYAVGAPGAPVTFAAAPGERYAAVELRGGPGALLHAGLERGERLLVLTHPPDTHTRIEDARFDTWGDVAIDLAGTAGLTVRRTRFGLQTALDDALGETIRARRSGHVLIEGNVFGRRIGYRDAIDLQDCREGPWPEIVGNRFEGGEDDAIDLDRCSAFVIGNHIRDFRPADLADQRQGINGGGVTGDGDVDVLIANNVIDGCYHGVGFKNGARPVLVNNTIVNGHIGVTLYQSARGQPQPHGVMVNNLLWNNVSWDGGGPQDVLLHGRWWPQYNQADAEQGTLDARFNTFASGGEVPVGEGNDAADPLLVEADGVPRPGPGSPAIDSGLEEGLPDGAGGLEALLGWLATDFRGHPRAREADRLPGIDRGAIEAD